jgi:hypothetical protein
MFFLQLFIRACRALISHLRRYFLPPLILEITNFMSGYPLFPTDVWGLILDRLEPFLLVLCVPNAIKT